MIGGQVDLLRILNTLRELRLQPSKSDNREYVRRGDLDEASFNGTFTSPGGT